MENGRGLVRGREWSWKWVWSRGVGGCSSSSDAYYPSAIPAEYIVIMTILQVKCMYIL